MGLFSRNYDKAGPGVDAAEPRKKGPARFIELLLRDFTAYWAAGALALVGLLPALLGTAFGVMTHAVLPTLVCGAVGGAIAGPGFVGLYDTLARSLRDEPGFWWYTYKKAVRRNARAALVPGAFFGLLLSAVVLQLSILLLTDTTNLLGWLSALLCLLLWFGIANYYWLQLAVVELNVLNGLKNSLLMWISFLPRTLLAAVLQILYWALISLFFPLSLLPLALTTAWLPALMGALAIYAPVEKAFHIEENVRQLHEARRKQADN